MLDAVDNAVESAPEALMEISSAFTNCMVLDVADNAVDLEPEALIETSVVSANRKVLSSAKEITLALPEHEKLATSLTTTVLPLATEMGDLAPDDPAYRPFSNTR